MIQVIFHFGVDFPEGFQKIQDCWSSFRLFCCGMVKKHQEYFETLTISRPSVKYHAWCYHTERYKDRDGKSHSKSVTKHRDHFICWGEDSEFVVPLPTDLDDHPLVLLYCTLRKEKWSAEAFQAFKLQQERFREKHANCDKNRSFQEESNLMGFRSIVLSGRNLDAVPRWLRERRSCLFYFLILFFGLNYVCDVYFPVYVKCVVYRCRNAFYAVSLALMRSIALSETLKLRLYSPPTVRSCHAVLF